MQHIAHTFWKGGVGRCSNFWRTKFYYFWDALHCALPLPRWRWPLQQLLALKSLSFLGGSTLRTLFAMVALAVAAAFDAQNSTIFEVHCIDQPVGFYNLKRVIVTPAVNQSFFECLQGDIHSTGQKSHCVNTDYQLSQCFNGRCSNFWRRNFYHFWGALHWSHPSQRWRWPLQ